MKFLPLAAPKVVIFTTANAASDETFIIPIFISVLNIHVVLFCCVLLWSYYSSWWIYQNYIPVFFRVAPLTVQYNSKWQTISWGLCKIDHLLTTVFLLFSGCQFTWKQHAELPQCDSKASLVFRGRSPQWTRNILWSPRNTYALSRTSLTLAKASCWVMHE